MAIDTYDKLQAAVADTVNRDDLSADVTSFSPAQIDGAIKRAIAYAEKTLQRDLVGRGGTRDMEALSDALSTATGAESVALPADCLGIRMLALAGEPACVLDFVDPNTLFTRYPSKTVGRPMAYTLVGATTAYLRPVPDRATPLRLIYVRALPALSAAQSTNWLLAAAPDLYVGAAMLELCLYLENDDRLQFWKAYVDEKLDRLMAEDRHGRWPAVPQRPDVQVALA
ncbi:MAG: hypothetical protein SFV21_17705 [Rhodospirillaceae bacterium]|nr:hypothetical protein [Rhodospirillaceae bacterium]